MSELTTVNFPLPFVPSQHMSIQTWPILEHVDKGTEVAWDTGGLDVCDSMSFAFCLFHPLFSTVDAPPAGLAKFIRNQHHLVLNSIIQF